MAKKQKEYKYHTSHSYYEKGIKYSCQTQLYKTALYCILDNDPAAQFKIYPKEMVKIEKDLLKFEKNGEISNLEFGRLITVVEDKDGFYVEKSNSLINMRKFGPKTATHPSIGELCPACKLPFKEGDFTTLIALGPGNSPEEQQKALEGKAYNAVAVEVHYSCATGNNLL